MKNKKVAVLLASTITSAALLTGCSTDSYNPSNDYESEMYGPAQIYEDILENDTEKSETTEIETETTEIETETTEIESETIGIYNEGYTLYGGVSISGYK
jgi:hypothetical protein